MSIEVTADVVHPRARANIDRIPSTPYINAEMVRVFLVQGLDDFSVNMSATALARGLTNFGIPKQGTLAPGVLGSTYGCSATSYDTEVIPNNDNSVYCIVTYRTPIPRALGGGPAIYVLNDQCSKVQSTRDTSPKDLTQITIKFIDPDDKNNILTRPSEITYTHTIRKLSVSGYVARQDLSGIRACLIRSTTPIGWDSLRVIGSSKT